MSPAEVCGAFLYAELFNWVLEPKRITVDQAMRCAKREPGRSWEAIESELNKLGEHAQNRLGCTDCMVGATIQPVHVM